MNALFSQDFENPTIPCLHVAETDNNYYQCAEAQATENGKTPIATDHEAREFFGTNEAHGRYEIFVPQNVMADLITSGFLKNNTPLLGATNNDGEKNSIAWRFSPKAWAHVCLIAEMQGITKQTVTEKTGRCFEENCFKMACESGSYLDCPRRNTAKIVAASKIPSLRHGG